MWKWTYPNEIKAIILDGDSLDKAYVEYKYEDNISDVHICKSCYICISLEVGFNCETGIYKYYDVPSLLDFIMSQYTCASF